jgi:hypothetical protein
MVWGFPSLAKKCWRKRNKIKSWTSLKIKSWVVWVDLNQLRTTSFKKYLEFFELMVHCVRSYNYSINNYSPSNLKLIICMEYNVELMSSVINLFVLGTTLFKKNLEFFELMVHCVGSYNYMLIIILKVI